MIRVFRCLVCGREAKVGAVFVLPGVVTWPPLYCATCPGHPHMTNGVDVGGN